LDYAQSRLETPENPGLKQQEHEVRSFANRFSGVTQMVRNGNKTTLDSPVNQGVRADIPKPNKTGASTPFDFEARNLTAYARFLLAFITNIQSSLS
jgi:hypothetical protein